MVKFRIPTKADYFSSESLSNQAMVAKITAFVNGVAKLEGCDIFTEDYTPLNLRLALGSSVLIINVFMTFHNVYYFGNDLVRFCFLMVAFASALQSVSMLDLFIGDREKIKGLIRRIEKLCEKHNTAKFNAIFERWIILSCHFALVIGIVLILCGLLIFVYPAIFYAIFREKILHMGFELPFVDWRTTFGYTLNFIYVGAAIFYFLIGLFTSIQLTILNIFLSFAQFEFIGTLLNEFNELIAGNQTGENAIKIKKIIGEITENHYELIE